MDQDSREHIQHFEYWFIENSCKPDRTWKICQIHGNKLLGQLLWAAIHWTIPNGQWSKNKWLPHLNTRFVLAENLQICFSELDIELVFINIFTNRRILGVLHTCYTTSCHTWFVWSGKFKFTLEVSSIKMKLTMIFVIAWHFLLMISVGSFDLCTKPTLYVRLNIKSKQAPNSSYLKHVPVNRRI